VLVAIVAVFVWEMPAEWRSTIGLKLAYWAGAFSPGVVIGAIIGFVAWDRRWFFWSTAIALTINFALLFPGGQR
jgi:hypothetical protein